MCRPAVRRAAATSPRNMPNSIIATANEISGMKEFREDVRLRAINLGRDPDEIKVLYLVYPILGETREEARNEYSRLISEQWYPEAAVAGIGQITDIDFSVYDLDKPLPKLTTNGELGALDKFQQWGSGKTLRQLAAERHDNGLDLIGKPDEVADRMGLAMEAVGGDGFLISTPFQRINRRIINEVCEGLVPALQRRGLMRTEYTQLTCAKRCASSEVRLAAMRPRRRAPGGETLGAQAC